MNYRNEENSGIIWNTIGDLIQLAEDDCGAPRTTMHSEIDEARGALYVALDALYLGIADLEATPKGRSSRQAARRAARSIQTALAAIAKEAP